MIASEEHDVLGFAPEEQDVYSFRPVSYPRSVGALCAKHIAPTEREFKLEIVAINILLLRSKNKQ